MEKEAESSSPHPSSETDTVGAAAAALAAAAATKPKKQIKPIGKCFVGTYLINCIGMILGNWNWNERVIS